MARFGVQVERDDEWRHFTLRAGQHYRSPGEIFVEGDASSASYFLAAGVIATGPVRVEGIGKSSLQGDLRFAEVLQEMGADIRLGDYWIEARAPQAGYLRAVDLDCNHIPDAAMTLAVAALFARRHLHSQEYRQLACKGNRPACGNGERITQAGRYS